MQRKNQSNSPEPSITLTGLSVTNEPALVNFAIGLFAIQHPLEKPHAAMARQIGTSEGSLIQAAAGNGHLGIDAWIAIEKMIGVPLMQIYIEQKRGASHDPDGGSRNRHSPRSDS